MCPKPRGQWTALRARYSDHRGAAGLTAVGNTLITEVAPGDIPLKWDVFVTPGIPIVTSDPARAVDDNDLSNETLDAGSASLGSADARKEQRTNDNEGEIHG